MGSANYLSYICQAYRTRVTDSFRACRSGVLVASDVAARGVDFPDVTMVVQATTTQQHNTTTQQHNNTTTLDGTCSAFRVVQIGAPDSREQYVHRTGRTGRANKAGHALLLLSDWEERASMEMLR